VTVVVTEVVCQYLCTYICSILVGYLFHLPQPCCVYSVLCIGLDCYRAPEYKYLTQKKRRSSVFIKCSRRYIIPSDGSQIREGEQEEEREIGNSDSAADYTMTDLKFFRTQSSTNRHDDNDPCNSSGNRGCSVSLSFHTLRVWYGILSH